MLIIQLPFNFLIYTRVDIATEQLAISKLRNWLCFSTRYNSDLPTSAKKHKLFAFTIPLKPLNTFYICILPETFQNKLILLEVVIYEIAHALHALNGKAGYPHGYHFKKWGRLILKRVKSSIEKLPIPFCNCAKPSIKILNEKYKET